MDQGSSTIKVEQSALRAARNVQLENSIPFMEWRPALDAALPRSLDPSTVMVVAQEDMG